MKNILKLTLYLPIILLFGCKTYQLTTETLLQQFANILAETKINFIVAFPFIFPGTVIGNSLTKIKVLDPNNKERTIPLTNHTGVRITKKDVT